MIRRAELVEDCGNEYVMVDILTAGWSALQNLRNKNFNLVLHAHRAGHAAFTKNPRHGISMKVIAKVSRVIGIDQLHVGTAVGKMYETKEDVLENCKALKEKMGGLKPVMPVASGGLYAGHVPELVKIFGNDFVIQAGGGMHALGTRTGARAMRQALDATMKKIPLKEYSKTHRELRAALEKFD
jgi:ribulose-bisphosphate carboxylase large chain